MPTLEGAELARIPCPRCSREHFVYVDRATREALAYDGSGTRVLAGETLPTAFTRLLNAPCDECQRVKDLDKTSSPVAWPSSPANPAAIPNGTWTAASVETEPTRKITRVRSAATRLAHACHVPHAH